ncbi:endonuclease/exonuclease/phosphatase family protein [Flavobacterium caeni]|uniref:Endonuclease/Exonuclease/phosphatase family protein n=1 Tax=Flavobacterium caeni TaxID=490189 RepID=A0A1G5KBR7_9FLAO|nr:endonuclease/exonuclease/phosphatase family protein [Flavobacterium caeni]SCY98063.1 Endonuclease/Exonuclease/phosphatase family protein [Flavobacterium caeni]
MKIVSWNLERPNNNPKSIKNTFIVDLIEKISPDIIFLTETNSSINFSEYFCHKSEELPEIHENQRYKTGENRITIFSKFPIERVIETYDSYTAICCQVNSEIGELLLYGSIIGSFGGKDEFFKNDLRNQKSEIEILARNHNLIYSGDLNISFSGFPYPSKNVIYDMSDFFKSNSLRNITSGNENSAIHVVTSEEILNTKKVTQEMINIQPQISDHNLVIVEMH